ncbi:hypothetical protein [uncultured Methanobrevibacter sp.]|uniref:hypothetical protein n=1 Tax=uncultured Methanobrevibacter sp. TaxID=253161 RepID=UPI0025DEA56B|nr:hypothetical protein [uncultured Methanobrevibacter sp.]
MITCRVCGCLNDSSNAICCECGSDLSDSEDWDNYDDGLNFEEAEEIGYVDSDFYDE